MGNEASHSQAPPDADGRPPAPSHVWVTIRWPHGARSASVCGTFNDWKQTPMAQSAEEPGTWLKELELKPGTHQYKFIIDGQWKHDPSAPTVLDALGNINNFVSARPAGGGGRGGKGGAHGLAGGGSAHGGKSSTARSTTAGSSSGLETSSSNEGLRAAVRVSSDPYSLVELRSVPFAQLVPPKEDLLVQHAASMMLPPQLLLNLPHLAGDGEKPPVHVQLNHLFLHGSLGHANGGGGGQAYGGAGAGAQGQAAGGTGAGSLARRGQGCGAECGGCSAGCAGCAPALTPGPGVGPGPGVALGSGVVLGPGVVVYSLCTRFGESFVTSVFYKPRAPRHGAGRAAQPPAASDAPPAGEARGAGWGNGGRSGIAFVRLSIPQASTRRDDKAGRDYVSYEVEAVLGVRGATMCLRSSRRYSHFCLLHTMLLRELGSRGQYAATVGRLLPPKRTFGNFDAAFIAERRAALERYLQACVGCEAVRSSAPFCHFIDAAPSQAPQLAQPQAPSAGPNPSSYGLLGRVCAKQGYLLKLSGRRLAWRARYVCLCEGQLLAYYSEAVANPFTPLHALHAPAAQIRRHSLSSLPSHFVFSVATAQHEWWLGARTEAGREAWLLALTHAGATLWSPPAELSDGGSAAGGSSSFSDAAEYVGGAPSASHSQASCGAAADARAPAVRGSASAAAVVGSGGGRAGSAGWGSACGSACGGALLPLGGAPSLVGSLLKRPSKVHVLHDLDEGSPRWVARAFALLPAQRLLVYAQEAAAEQEGQQQAPHATDVLADAQGILPLGSYSHVEEVRAPGDDGLFAFRLCPPSARGAEGEGGDGGEPAPAAAAAGGAEAGAPREPHATDSFVLLAHSEESRREWVRHIGALLQPP